MWKRETEAGNHGPDGMEQGTKNLFNPSEPPATVPREPGWGGRYKGDSKTPSFSTETQRGMLCTPSSPTTAAGAYQAPQ